MIIRTIESFYKGDNQDNKVIIREIIRTSDYKGNTHDNSDYKRDNQNNRVIIREIIRTL